MKYDFLRVTRSVGSKVSLEPGLLNLSPELLAFLAVAERFVCVCGVRMLAE